MDFKADLIYNCENTGNSKLYECLATNYDISGLARKISAAKYARINLISLKKTSNLTV